MANQIGIQHQIRRDTASNLVSYTGPQGEFLLDTVSYRILLHDGVTQGGFPTGMADTQTITQSTTVLLTTAVAMVMSTASGIVITLPAVASYPPGQVLTIADGLANSSVANITIQTASTADIIWSSSGAQSTSWTLSFGGAAFRAISNSSHAWVGAFNA